MRYLSTAICLVTSMMFVGTTWAQDGPGNGDRRAEMRKKMMAEFDADGDGELSDDERAKAREEMRSRRGDRVGNRDQADGPRGDRGRREGAEGRRGGPGRAGAQAEPGKLFDKFDSDGDGQLSLAEFKKLTETMRAGRGARRPEADSGGARPDGPPGREGRRRPQRDESLQNPGDRQGPPPRREGRRRLNDEDGAQERGPREGGPRERGQRGGRARGSEGGQPNPEAIFKRFDENGDSQLSREEFMSLSERMRERAGARGERGARGGRGQGRGGPGADDEAPRRPRRPARPQLDDGADIGPTEDNSV